MEKTNITDNAQTYAGEECLTDITGVKNASSSYPDGKDGGNPCDADKGESPIAGEIESALGGDSATAEEALEAEFDALINGKFSGVYKKRTEGIIRKRLRSVKSAQAAESSTQVSEPQPSVDASQEGQGVAGEQSAIAIEQTRAQNKKRPIENGLGGSCGMVTKVNVSALDGQGVLAILRRVGSGEKISFK